MPPRRQRFRFAVLEHALAVLAVFCGSALAVVHLVFKPVEIVGTLPPGGAPAENNGRVYFAQGSRDRAKGASWVRKRRQILTAAPGEITLTEDELNAWFASGAHMKQARNSSPAASDPAEVGQPDFRIAGGLLQIAAPATVRALGMTAPLIVQMRGDFKRTEADARTGVAGGVLMYSPREVFAGSLPLHRIPGATAFLLNRALERQALPGEALAAWRKITRVVISGGELRITISP